MGSIARPFEGRGGVGYLVDYILSKGGVVKFHGGGLERWMGEGGGDVKPRV